MKLLHKLWAVPGTSLCFLFPLLQMSEPRVLRRRSSEQAEGGFSLLFSIKARMVRTSGKSPSPRLEVPSLAPRQVRGQGPEGRVGLSGGPATAPLAYTQVLTLAGSTVSHPSVGCSSLFKKNIVL